ncbi:hypothetical protein O7635_09770 [Asanoa sp. WMMD1127]|uniref:hypothetical protein n=1 Tax=Asanoa sp. WMMD1127 TaxID=3016107 RepID=UPI0024159FCA|nr:hypothetical protein [Asanoa sp. WMMD1127]MDG4822141.1 hypothetical protein [Asanoa sp. WMMD1127]
MPDRVATVAALESGDSAAGLCAVFSPARDPPTEAAADPLPASTGFVGPPAAPRDDPLPACSGASAT